MILARRRFLLGAGALLTAPAIVRVSSLDALPAFAAVPLWLWYFDSRGGVGNDRWWMSGSPVAPDLKTARASVHFPDPAPVHYEHWTRRERWGDAVMRRRSVLSAPEHRDIAEASHGG